MTTNQSKKVSQVISDQEYLTTNKPHEKGLISNQYPYATAALNQNGTLYHLSNKHLLQQG